MTDPSIEQLMASMPYAAHLGIALDSASPDRVVGHLAWTESLCTAAGIMHGGALMSLADTIGAVCAVLCLPEGATTATSSSTTHMIRAVRGGTVLA
ncbi:MAG: PaaI family thioesterase, partial [Nocardioidaceae bacterium]